MGDFLYYIFLNLIQVFMEIGKFDIEMIFDDESEESEVDEDNKD